MSASFRFILSLLILVNAGACIGGRSSAPPPSRSLRYTPPADRYVKSVLLDFDGPYDASFVDSSGRILLDPDNQSNRVFGLTSTSINLGSLLRGREFPGAWNLIGFRVRSDRGGSVLASLDGAGIRGALDRTFTALPAATWRTVWMKIEPTAAASPAAASVSQPTLAIDSLRLRIAGPPGQTILIDDITLAQSGVIVSDSTLPESRQRWVVRRIGLEWQVLVNGQTVYSLPAAPFHEEGYRAIEANDVRVILQSPTSIIAIDRAGRLIENGVAKSEPRMARFARTAAENAAPALIETLEDHGRIERNLPGDRNNDGYDETRGCYVARATHGRLTLTLDRQVAPVRWPVIEVHDLPPGEVSVWVAGELVPSVFRLQDGRVLVELPIEISRRVEVRIRTK